MDAALLDSLVMWPGQMADPWHRLSALEYDCLTLVEFSEIHGPKPLITVPQSPGAHFDEAALSVWLMTCDYRKSDDLHQDTSVDLDVTQTLMHNDEQGVSAFAQYFTLFDIDARGFVRPLVLAYVTKSSSKLPPILCNLREAFEEIVTPVLQCNRKQFLKELCEMIDALDNMEKNTVCSYYELYHDSSFMLSPADRSQSVVDDARQTRLQSVNLKARRLYGRLSAAHREVSVDQHGVSTDQHCNVHHVDVSKLLSQITGQTQKQSDEPGTSYSTTTTTSSSSTTTTTTTPVADDNDKQLRIVAELSPCAYETFCGSIRNVWSRFRNYDHSLRFLTDQGTTGCSEPGTSSCESVPQLRFGGFAVLKLPRSSKFRGRSMSLRPELTSFLANNSAEEEYMDFKSIRRLLTGDDDSGNIETGGGDHKLLSSVVHLIPQLLYPLLTGQFVLICGSDIRKSTGVQLLRKLRWFIPQSPDSPFITTVRWHEGVLPTTAVADFKLYGQNLPAGVQIQDYVANNIRPYLSILDLNGNVFHSAQYRGKILTFLTKKRSNSFISDRTLILHILSSIGELSQLAYVLYYYMHSDEMRSSKKNDKFLTIFSEKFQLTPSDTKILRYFVELLRQQDDTDQSADRVDWEGAFKSVFLDSKPSIQLIRL